MEVAVRAVLKSLVSSRVALAAWVSSVAFAAVGFVYEASALAVESKSEEAVKSMATKVGEEGVTIFLIVVAAITVLIATIIGVTLGVKKLKSYAK
jgi:hypothetical protein